MTDLTEFERGQDCTLEAVSECLDSAERDLADRHGDCDPLTRAVLALVREKVTAFAVELEMGRSHDAAMAR